MSAFSSIRAGISFQERRGLLLATFLATTALSLSYFGQSLWRDEASSVWFARLPLVTLLTALCDPHPPGYYLLLKAWLIGGEQEFWLRLPSLLAAVLAVAFTYRLGRETCGYRCAWLAALLLALHPLQSWYAAEIRMYMLIQALGLLLVWLGWRLLAIPAQQTPRREIVAYWLVALVALGLDYAALLPMGLLQLLWLVRGRPGARRWLSLQAAVLLPAALLWSNFSQLQMLRHSYPAVFVAVQANHLGFDLTPAAAVYLLQLGVIGLTIASLVLTWVGFRRCSGWLDRPMVQYLLLGGWLVLLLLVALPRAYTVKRQLVVLLPYLALLVSYGLARLPRPTGELLAGLGLLVTLLVLPNHQREPWRAIVANLVRTEPDQATVIWVDEQSVPAFDYYLRNGGAAAEPIRWTPFLGGNLPQLPSLIPRPGGTLWIVTVESAYRHLIVLLPEDFYGHYQLLEERYEAGVGLHRYRRQASFTSSRSHWTEPDRLAEWGLLLPSPLDTCQPMSEAKRWIVD